MIWNFNNLFYSVIDKIKVPIQEKDQSYTNLSNENILLLAVENQNNDFLYGNIAKDKEKSSPVKLNVYKITNSYKNIYNYILK